MCLLSSAAATVIMVLSVLGGIAGGYFAAQKGTDVVAKLWPSAAQKEDKPYPLAPLVAVPAFCAGFYIAFLFVAGIARGIAC